MTRSVELEGFPDAKPWGRILFAGAGICALVAVVGGLIGASQPFEFGSAAAGPAAGIAMLAGCVAATLLAFALVAVSASCGESTLMTQFRHGDALVDWAFPAEEWSAFLAKRDVATRFKSRKFAVIFACLVVLGVFLSVLAIDDPRITVPLPVASAVGAGGLFWWLRRLLASHAQRRAAFMKRHPRVLIGRDGL